MFYSRENENDYCDPIIFSRKNYIISAMGLTMTLKHTHTHKPYYYSYYYTTTFITISISSMNYIIINDNYFYYYTYQVKSSIGGLEEWGIFHVRYTVAVALCEKESFH